MAVKDSADLFRDWGNASFGSSPPSVRIHAAHPWRRRAGGQDKMRKQAAVWLESGAHAYISQLDGRANEIQSQRYPSHYPQTTWIGIEGSFGTGLFKCVATLYG